MTSEKRILPPVVNRIRPIISMNKVGAGMPESGVFGAAEAVAVVLGVALAVEVGRGVVVALAVVVGEADGVATKAGPSAA